MIESAISPECRRVRHTACARPFGECDCECHDDETEDQAAGRLARVGDKVGPGAEPDAVAGNQPAVAGNQGAMYPCRVLGCTHPPFPKAQGEAVHYARVHGQRGSDPLATPVRPRPRPEPETEVPDPDMVTFVVDDGQPMKPLSNLAYDVLAAVAFLDRKEPTDVLDEAIDRWAAETIERNSEIKQLVALRASYQQRSTTP